MQEGRCRREFGPHYCQLGRLHGCAISLTHIGSEYQRILRAHTHTRINPYQDLSFFFPAALSSLVQMLRSSEQTQCHLKHHMRLDFELLNWI